MRLGVCYMGSKNSIARDLVSVLPSARYFVDLFSGGCAVTHAALLSGRWEKFIVNDKNPMGQRVFIDSIAGRNNGRWREWISHEEFDERKDSDPVVALCWSFGNNPRKGYLYSREKEPLKRAVHAYRVHGDPSQLKALHMEGAKDIPLQATRSCEALERLQALEVDYSEVEIPADSCVYADIPYGNTVKYTENKGGGSNI